MFFPGKRAFVASIALWATALAPLFGYLLSGTSWPIGSTIVMQLELGATNVVLQDGLGTWNGSAANSLSLWNQYLKRVHFGWVNNSTAPKGAHNGFNTVSFAPNVYGEAFGRETLAVTVGWSSSSYPHITNETDVIFNTAIQFNSYRGPLQNNLYDFHRIALHEFGHVLGLAHPDEGYQGVVAIMNSVIGNLDHIAADDIAGVIDLYGYHITGSSVVEGQMGIPFSYRITAENMPTTFTAAPLPPGLSINTQTGVISGIPTDVGNTDVTVMAHSALGDARGEITIVIDGPRISSPPNLQPIYVGDYFTYQISANNNPVTFGVSRLPPGLRLDTHTGLISGAVTRNGQYDFTITATGNGTGTASYLLTIYALSVSADFIKSLPVSAFRLLVDKPRNRIYATMAAARLGVAIIDVSNLSVVKTLTTGSPATGMAMAPDGEKLFVAGGDSSHHSIKVVDLDAGAFLPSLPAPFPTLDVEVSASGSLFVSVWDYAGSSHSAAGVAELSGTTGGLIRTFPGTVTPSFIDLSPDRKTLFVGPIDGNVVKLSAVDVSAVPPAIRQEVIWDNPPGPILDVQLSHDGRFLGIVDQRSQAVFKVPTSNLGSLDTPFILPGASLAPRAVAFSADDKTIFVAAIGNSDGDEGIYVFDAASRRFLRKIKTIDFQSFQMVTDPSGRFLFLANANEDSVLVFMTGQGNVSPAPKPRSLLNISTRSRTGVGEDVLIGGFIISGLDAKKLAIRAIGPSLPVSGKLADPMLELRDQAGRIVASNDNWNSQREAAVISGVPPNDERESVIVTTLEPGSYTTVMRGTHSTSGVALVEVYDLSSNSNSKLANISTRGKVEMGDNVMIGGFIIGGNQPTKVIVRAIGPSLASAGVQGALQDPILELHGRDGSLIFQNDNWRTNQQADIIATRIPPTDNRESAIVATLQPGNYTAIVRGKNNATGVALVEIYNLEQ